MKGSEKAYAKLNIGLRVGAKRADGFHDLDTYFHLISLHDVINFTLKRSSSLSIVIKGNEKYLKQGETDLMEKAAVMYSKVTGIIFELEINIEKNIPSPAGLGGGSSDAAAVLSLLENCFKSGINLFPLALSLGSDVPFFVSGMKAAHGRGRGEILSPVTPARGMGFLLPSRAGKLSTGAAFAALDARTDAAPLLPAWSTDSRVWLKFFGNDFLAVQGESPEKRLAKEGKVLLSGSGSCYFITFGSEEERREAEKITSASVRIPFSFLF
jgi:4-diphosphocytidyl-2C-methyl-D-erythritol 2-phosphate synthase